MDSGGPAGSFVNTPQLATDEVGNTSLEAGAHRASVTAMDRAGNVSPSEPSLLLLGLAALEWLLSRRSMAGR